MKINFSLNRYIIFIALIDITFLKKNIYVEKFLFKRYFNLKFVRYENKVHVLFVFLTIRFINFKLYILN